MRMLRLGVILVMLLAFDASARQEISDDSLPWLSSDEQPVPREKPKVNKGHRAIKASLLTHEALGLRLLFEREQQGLSKEHEMLVVRHLSGVKSAASRRLLISAYASRRKGSKGVERRVGLARGVAVREALVRQGFTKSLVTIELMGRARDGEADDRVDVTELN